MITNLKNPTLDKVVLLCWDAYYQQFFLQKYDKYNWQKKTDIAKLTYNNQLQQIKMTKDQRKKKILKICGKVTQGYKTSIGLKYTYVYIQYNKTYHNFFLLLNVCNWKQCTCTI